MRNNDNPQIKDNIRDISPSQSSETMADDLGRSFFSSLLILRLYLTKNNVKLFCCLRYRLARNIKLENQNETSFGCNGFYVVVNLIKNKR